MNDPGPVPDFLVQFKQLLGPLFASLVGSLSRHAHAIAEGRGISLRVLLLEPPVVVLMAILAGAAGEMMSLSAHGTWGLAGVASYYGPRPVLRMAERIIERRLVRD